MKIGGVLCHSTYRSQEFQVVTGVGLNLDNSQPTTCINDILRQQHTELQQQDTLQPITREVLRVSILACLLSNALQESVTSVCQVISASRLSVTVPVEAFNLHSLFLMHKSKNVAVKMNGCCFVGKLAKQYVLCIMV